MAEDALIQLLERSGQVDADLLARARARDEPILTALVAEGGDPTTVLQTAAAAWGMLPVLRAAIEAPPPTDLPPDKLAALRAVPAAPIGEAHGVLHLAITSPFAYDELDALELPRFRTYLALAGDVAAAHEKLSRQASAVPDVVADAMPEDPFVRMAREAKLNAAAAYGYDANADLEAARESLLFGATDDGEDVEDELEEFYMDSRARVPVSAKAPAATPIEPAKESSPDLASGAWGRLREVRMSELVQMLSLAGSSGRIDVRLDVGISGRVDVKEGEVWGAELGVQKAEAAFFALCRATDGRFLMSAFTGAGERQINTPTQDLLVEALRAGFDGAPVAPAEVRQLSGAFLEDIEAIELGPPADDARQAEDRLDRQSYVSQLNLAKPDTNLGKKVGDYEILEEVGKGATSIVYRARGADGREVALKVLNEQSVKDEAFLRRFKREIRTHAALQHEHVLAVHDFGRVDDTFFLVLDFMPRTLDDLLAAGTAPGAVVALVMSDVLRALVAAQARSVVHRDLKPSNVLLSAEGAVRVADFGLARNELDPNRSSTGAIVGTPAYMSPEQALGQPVDGRSDMFSLASIGYELLTGVCRFARQSAPMALMAVCQGQYESLFQLAPSVPPRLEEVIARLSARNPDDRYATADEALQALSPLVAAIKLRYPDLLGRFANDPDSVRAELLADQASLEMSRGRQLLAAGDKQQLPQAALAFLRAESLGTSNEAAGLFDKLAAQEGYVRAPPRDQQLLALEAKLATDPSSRATLRRAANLARNHGALLTATTYLLRYLQVAPGDDAVRELAARLLGPDVRIPYEWAAPERAGRPSAAPAGTPSQPIAALREEDVASGPRPPARARAEQDSGGRGKIAAALVFVAALVVTGALFLPEIIGEQAEETGTLTPIRDGLSPAEAARAHLENGRAHLSVGAARDAIASFDAALGGDPGLSTEMETRLLRARAHMALSNHDAAETDLRVIIRVLDASNPLAKDAAAALATLPKK